MSRKPAPTKALEEKPGQLGRGETVVCKGLAGSTTGPYEVDSSDGAVTLVRMRGGTLLALPTVRLRALAPASQRE